VEANRAGCVNYFTLRRHHYCASRDQTIREGRPASLDLGPIWRPTTCWEIVRLLGRVLIHAQIAMLRSRWNVLAIAAFFFSHWATAAEKGDDRVSDILPTDTKLFLTMAVLGLAAMLIVLRRLI
jgi:hypothetical protein